MERIRIPVEGTTVDVSGLVIRPASARFIYIVAHGAGAGMEHPFLTSTSEALEREGIATLRYQFPYMEEGRRRPDPPHLLQTTVHSAVSAASAYELPMVAGGKSMGGRMTSSAAAAGTLSEVRGLIFLGFPLHAPGKPGVERARHLSQVGVPMLFLQGTRDPFAALDLLEPVTDELAPRATLHIVEGGDHSFKVLKRSGRNAEQVTAELVEAISKWADTIL
jgi:predicted alpha/beta-hydrolase family hydrolase